MPNEGFLQRWSRLKSEPAAPEEEGAAPASPVTAAPPAAAPPAAAPSAELPMPTLADADRLDFASDYSAFVARGVDSSVRRLAMKKLFADPHFNLIDGLDIYMSDYNIASPVSAEMLASLSHARSVFGRIDELLEGEAGDALEVDAAVALEAHAAEAPDAPDALVAHAADAPPTITAQQPPAPPALPPPDQEVA